MYYRYKAKDEDVTIRGLLFTKEWRYSNIKLPLAEREEDLLVIEEATSRTDFDNSKPVEAPVEAPKAKKSKKDKETSDATPATATSADTPKEPEADVTPETPAAE